MPDPHPTPSPFPFRPERRAALRHRLAAALAVAYDPAAPPAAAGPVGLHVFDALDGLRLVVVRESQSGPAGSVVHAVADVKPLSPLGLYLGAHPGPRAELARVGLARVLELTGYRRADVVASVTTADGLPHWYLRPPVESGVTL